MRWPRAGEVSPSPLCSQLVVSKVFFENPFHQPEDLKVPLNYFWRQELERCLPPPSVANWWWEPRELLSPLHTVPQCDTIQLLHTVAKFHSSDIQFSRQPRPSSATLWYSRLLSYSGLVGVWYAKGTMCIVQGPVTIRVATINIFTTTSNITSISK